MKKIFEKMKKKTYFSITVSTVVFAILALLLAWIDNYSNYNAQKFLPNVMFSSREMAETIFSMEVASLLAMLTLTFSVMMVVLTNYSSQLSPRTLQDFLESKTTRRIMGYYIGVITFALISLFFIKTGEYQNPVLSPVFGVLFFIAGIIIFAYFIHFISRSIQINIYIQKLTSDTDKLIEKKEETIRNDPRIYTDSLDNFKDLLEEDGIEIKNEKSGFLQSYNVDKLYEYAMENKVVVWCEKRVGDYVLEDEVLLKVYKHKDLETQEKCKEILAEAVQTGDETNLYEDLSAGTNKLVEIAVKALSPGINDPATAIFCIEEIGFLLQKMARVSEAKIYKDEKNEIRLIVRGVTFEKLLFHNFYQIKHYGINDMAVLDAILGALITISKDNHYEIKNQVWSFGKYIMSCVDYSKKTKLEEEYIKERYYQLAKEAAQSIKFREMFPQDREK